MSLKSYIIDFFEAREARKSICVKCRFHEGQEIDDLCLHPLHESKTKDYISGKIHISYGSCIDHNIDGDCCLFKEKE